MLLLMTFLPFVTGWALSGCCKDVQICTQILNKIRRSSYVGRTIHTDENGFNSDDERCPMVPRMQQRLDECIKILNKGGVCYIPTNIAYYPKAKTLKGIKRIYDIKSHPSEKHLSLWPNLINETKSVEPEGKGREL